MEGSTFSYKYANHQEMYIDDIQGVTMSKIGILHPGEMGVSLAASAIHNGHEVYWTSQGRSDKTRARAEKYNLIEIEALPELCRMCEIMLSICPPHAAETVSKSVVDAGFKGLYLDANAISPQRAIEMDRRMQANNIRFVDGGIIGGPAWRPRETWLYLSGQYADKIAACFSKGPLETEIIGDEIGKASALKMCYAAYSKGTTALIAAVLATAEALGVRQELYQQWESGDPGFSEQSNGRVIRAAAKAWRFEGEMKEIESTFRESGLPHGFHEAAAEVYHRMAGLEFAGMTPTMETILKVISGSVD
jgi:3-hydroxyisobutyrate dehydrogenase-like beta-hydroxyacid dehydrogenase